MATRKVPLMTLRDVTGRFVTIHGQNQHQEIFDEKNHINILDDYLGKAAAEKKAEVQAVWEAYGKCRRNLETMETVSYTHLRDRFVKVETPVVS